MVLHAREASPTRTRDYASFIDSESTETMKSLTVLWESHRDTIFARQQRRIMMNYYSTTVHVRYRLNVYSQYMNS